MRNYCHLWTNTQTHKHTNTQTNIYIHVKVDVRNSEQDSSELRGRVEEMETRDVEWMEGVSWGSAERIDSRRP